ncbi:trypsin-like serine peptidase [Staphylococcus pseudintermedius]|uniref:trypsin-like serine peptidase n=1 Tax=Staphylococcus pseudintermedius TaxID=283734 RepID=UPI0019F824D4|nr:trypsin-like peptidase domain-containing protein [Staphylococcus pseudintermedius]EGQ0322305.1 trypsin-like serine protease [Staphylococcus pseudintermedius]EGQ1621250.1 trypsin-like serine protease [Staphylococcus pseudintermedius]EGQ1657781.1 trypsin-like serine protease [Staphylococcus pseudintermedius]EGQ1705152.1 Exfoliative toxin A [Staphylococcus pseudintermedius]EGQ1723217.1 Exfoliative toxin A [Staphylococcus pseudintermedius]
MNKTTFKHFIFVTIIFMTAMLILGISTPGVYAKTYDEAEIIKKRDSFNTSPSTLSSEVFSKISETTRSPYSALGTVYVKSEIIASGILIGKNTIITNQHVARLAKQDPSKIIFTPASTRTEEGMQLTPYGQFGAEKVNESPYGGGIDLSIIKLKPNQDGKAAGDLIRPAKISDSIDIQAGDKISLLGYPNNYAPFSLYRSEIEIFDANLGEYFGYTEVGNSGSGLFDLKGELIGIHVGKGGKYNLPLGEFFNRRIGSSYSIDGTLGTIGMDLKKRAESED